MLDSNFDQLKINVVRAVLDTERPEVLHQIWSIISSTAAGGTAALSSVEKDEIDLARQQIESGLTKPWSQILSEQKDEE